jgi:hypothetical protein
MLDLFCGRWGWSKSFAKRGWECIGIDYVRPPEMPDRCTWLGLNILTVSAEQIRLMKVDFICASPPCEQFSVHGLKCFHKNPPYPALGMQLFNHTRHICEFSRVPYVIENVRAAQQFVGNAVHHCGPFYLWGSGVPAMIPQGILKGRRLMAGGYKGQTLAKSDKGAAAIVATIPPELAGCVVNYAEGLLRQRAKVRAEV